MWDPRARRFSLRVVYGLGCAAEGIKYNSMVYFLFFFYTQTIGLQPALCGLALLLSLIVDAIVDPVIGCWSDSTRSRLGRRHPFLYAAVLPFSFCFFALFMPPRDLGQQELFTWLPTFAVCTRVSASLFEIPHFSLSAELSRDYDERSKLQSWRTAFSWAFGITNALLVLMVFLPDTSEYPKGLLNPAGWKWAALTGACGILIVTLCLAIGTQRAALAAQPESAAVPALSVSDLWTGFREAFNIASFRYVVLAGLSVQIAFGTHEVLNQHQAVHFWNFNSRQLAIVIAAIMTGAIAVPFVTG
jgi:Na+/melibiose symporter-like transporter